MSSAPPALLLASQSSTRRRMLKAAGVTFEAVPAGLDEELAKAKLGRDSLNARQVAERLAALKAMSISAPAGTLVLGADQTVEREDGVILGKASDLEQARAQLLSLRGRAHRLHSAAAIIETGQNVWAATESVTMHVRPFGERFLDDYLGREGEALLWSAGGYRIEGLGAQLFERVEGSHFAVLGLPLLPLLSFLRDRGLLHR